MIWGTKGHKVAGEGPDISVREQRVLRVLRVLLYCCMTVSYGHYPLRVK